MTDYPWSTVWIVGASTGIGAEAVKDLAKNGVKVIASARSEDKLADLAAECEGVTPLPLDVTDFTACIKAVDSMDQMPDLVILNAAIYDPLGLDNYSADKARAMMDVNYGGVVNMLDPLMKAMTEKGAGHIALVASINGYVGLPNSAGYGPTKAALHNLAESLKAQLEAKGVTITLVNPGFVKTRLTAKNRFPMPQLMRADDAARRMLKGLVKKKFEVTFPYPFAFIVRQLGNLPRGVLFSFAKKMVR